MSDPHAMQRLCGLMRKAVQDYEMISPGDKIMVGVSGGKDSVALTIGLALLRRYLGFDYEVAAVTLDPQFDHQAVDYSPLAALFARYEVPYEVRRTEIGPIVFEYRQEKNPCSLCARLRRGALHTAAQELGCNKVALGHHLDDAVETFYMNLWREGRIGCFSPVTYVNVCSDIFAKFCHEALAECHYLSVRFTLRIEIRTTFTTTDWKCCKRILKYLLET